MRKFLSQLRQKFGMDEDDSAESEDNGEDYVELDSGSGEGKSKAIVRTFVLDDFEGIKPILDSLREGNTIALVNIKPLKDKDLVELKRSINKLKKTTDAIQGEIAGFGEDYIVAVPSFARIHRNKAAAPKKADVEME